MSAPINDKSRQSLVRAATAVLALNPGASFKEIAALAGVGRATLYRYFPSRDALIRELALAAIAEIDLVVETVSRQNLSSPEALRVFLEEVVPKGDRFHFLVSESSTYNDPEVSAAYSRQMQELDAFVSRLKQDGAIALDVPNAWVAAAIDALIWAAWSSVQTGTLADRDAATWVYRTLMQGLNQPAIGSQLP